MEKEDCVSPRGAVRFGEPSVAIESCDPGGSDIDMDEGNSDSTGVTSHLDSPSSSSRGVVFSDAVDVQEVPKGDDAVVKRKSQFARFRIGGVEGEEQKSVIRTKTRKTLNNIAGGMRSRKSAITPATSDALKDNKKTRKTLGDLDLLTKDDGPGAPNSEDIAEASSASLVSRRGNADSSEPLLPRRGVSKYKKRSRSMSRGPRRGRDRFRGVGALFSTSAARNAPRPPRATVDGDLPEGTSSKVVLSLLRKKRMMSPSPDRLSTASSERRSDLLKCRSADVEQVLREAQK